MSPTRADNPVRDLLALWLEPIQAAFTAPTWRLARVFVMGALMGAARSTRPGRTAAPLRHVSEPGLAAPKGYETTNPA